MSNPKFPKFLTCILAAFLGGLNGCSFTLDPLPPLIDDGGNPVCEAGRVLVWTADGKEQVCVPAVDLGRVDLTKVDDGSLAPPDSGPDMESPIEDMESPIEDQALPLGDMAMPPASDLAMVGNDLAKPPASDLAMVGNDLAKPPASDLAMPNDLAKPADMAVTFPTFKVSTFKVPETGFVAGAAGYINGDGNLDVVILNRGGYVVTLVGDGAGSFTTSQQSTTGNGPVGLVVADFDEDKRPDVATADATGRTVTILLGDGTGKFAPKASLPVGGEVSSIALGQFNPGVDSHIDIVVADKSNNAVKVFLSNADGTFDPPKAFAAGQGPNWVTVCDMTGDGKDDVITANSMGNGLSIMPFKIDRELNAPVHVASGGTNPRWVGCGIITGGKFPDLVVSHPFGNISTLAGLGGTMFGQPKVTGVGANPGAAGFLINPVTKAFDVFVPNTGSNNLTPLANDGQGILTPKPVIPVGAAPMQAVLGLFNPGNLGDFLVVNRDEASVTIMLQ